METLEQEQKTTTGPWQTLQSYHTWFMYNCATAADITHLCWPACFPRSFGSSFSLNLLLLVSLWNLTRPEQFHQPPTYMCVLVSSDLAYSSSAPLALVNCTRQLGLLTSLVHLSSLQKPLTAKVSSCNTYIITFITGLQCSYWTSSVWVT